MIKYCPKCGETKDSEAFSKNASNKDGLAYKCKECRKAYRANKKLGVITTKQPKKEKPTPAPKATPVKPTEPNASGICHQKIRRDATETEDRAAGFRFDLKASEFVLAQEPMNKEHSAFIERYEWLGKVGWAVKWCFTARHDGKLAGVVLMSEPTMATKYKKYEALIQRGAASSWAPKNLNSMLVMFGCRWMVNNTAKRLFTCYSDPAAGEIGTIYQACNFMYLGRGWGTKQGIMLPSGKLVSARDFTKTSAMKKWAKELGIQWQREWLKPNGYQDITAYPPGIKELLTEKAKQEIAKYPVATQESKGKYALVLGKDKREEKELKKTIIFKTYPYPKRVIDSPPPPV